jgi:hypothetical protein
LKAIKGNNTSGGTVDTAVVGVATHINEWGINKCGLYYITIQEECDELGNYIVPQNATRIKKLNIFRDF